MDAVVVGGGLDGLVAAAALARTGRRVALVERRSDLGGAAELRADTRLVHADVVAELGLARGEPVPLERGDGVVPERSQEGLGWGRAIARWAPTIRALADGAPVVHDDGPLGLVRGALAARRAAAADVPEVLRVLAMPAEAWLSAVFPDPLSRAALLAEGLVGGRLGPSSPGTAGALLVRLALAERPVAGGARALVEGAVASCRARGVEILVGREVGRVRVERGRVVGVSLDGGEGLDAPVVVAAVDLRSAAFGLLDPVVRPPSLAAAATRWRSRGCVAVARVSVADDRARRIAVVPDPSAIERAFDAVRRGRIAEEPPIVLHLDGDDGVAWVLGAPVEAAWTGAARDTLGRRVEEALAQAGVPGRVDEVLAPPDLAARYGWAGGHLFHGEHSAESWAPWRARPASGLPGLHLACGRPGERLGLAGLRAARVTR